MLSFFNSFGCVITQDWVVASLNFSSKIEIFAQPCQSSTDHNFVLFRIRIPVAPNTTITSYNSNIPSPNQQSIRSWKSSVSSIEVPQQDNKNSPEWATTHAHTSIQKPVSMQVSMATITLSGASSDKVVASPILAPHSASSVQQPDLVCNLPSQP